MALVSPGSVCFMRYSVCTECVRVCVCARDCEALFTPTSGGRRGAMQVLFMTPILVFTG